MPDVETEPAWLDATAYWELQSVDRNELKAPMTPGVTPRRLSEVENSRDLFARLYNPMVAGIILPGGGHNGFVAYSRPYFYNLMLRFFQARFEQID